MRVCDSFRLARLSLGARKKTTIQTIAGISFGLILLFPMLYIAIAFYGGFSAEINAETFIRRFHVDYGGMGTASGSVFCDEKYQKEIDSSAGITRRVAYQYVYLDNATEFSQKAYFSINGGPDTVIDGYSSNPYMRPTQLGLQIIDADSAADPFLDSDYAATPRPLVAGKAFTASNSKGEVMISTKFVEDYGLNIEEIIGSTMTLHNFVAWTSIPYSDSFEQLNQIESYKGAGYVTLWKDYRIVGVYDSAIYKKSSPRYSSINFELRHTEVSRLMGRDYFWITTASTDAGGSNEAPKRICRKMETEQGAKNQTWFYYEDEPKALSQKTTDAGFAFIPMGLGAFSRTIFDPVYTKTELLEFSSFQTAKVAYDTIYDCYHRSTTDDPLSPKYFYPTNIAHRRFFAYHGFYDRFFFICLGLGVFGGVIFVVAMLNMVSTLNFSIESMKEFLGICRAQGLRRRGVISIFFGQFMIVFGWAYLFTIALGGAACFGVKLLFDNTMAASITEDSAMVLTLKIGYMPVAFGIIVAVTAVISLAMSYFLVRRINRIPILDILFNDSHM